MKDNIARLLDKNRVNMYVEINKQLPKALEYDKKAIKKIARLLKVSPDYLKSNLKITNLQIDRDAKLRGKTRKQVIEEAICQDLFTL